MRSYRTAMLAVAILQSSSLGLATPAPQLVGGFMKYSQCDDLRESFDRQIAQANQQHQRCLGDNSNHSESGRSCSNAKCQSFHTKAFDALPKLQSTRVGQCRIEVDRSLSRCKSGFGAQLDVVDAEHNAFKASYEKHCLGSPKGDMILACKSLNTRIQGNRANYNDLRKRSEKICFGF